MADEWRTATVTELQQEGLLLVEDGNHGEYRPRPDEFVDAGVAFIRAADLDGGRVLFESAARINKRARARITKGIGARGDVLLSHKGTVGKVALVDLDAPPFVCSPQTTFWRTLNQEEIDRKYLYAFLRSSGFHAQLAARAGETDMAPYVSLTSQRGLSVTLPPISTQRAISRILGTLDDKIELNRRMSETLEAMARALFRLCIVDTPSGNWRAAPLSEWVDVFSGGTPSKANAALWSGPIKWISPKVMTSIHADTSDEQVDETAIGNGTRIAPKGSTLVMVRGMGLHKGVRVSQAREDVAFSQDVKALVPKLVHEDLLFFAILNAQEQLLERVESSGHGTGRLPSELLMGIQVTMPDRPMQQRLAPHFTALNNRIAVSRSQARELARLRDALLPKLVAGDLRGYWVESEEGANKLTRPDCHASKRT